MRWIIAALAVASVVPIHAGAAEPTSGTKMTESLFQFTSADSVSAWSAIDDRVMGGVSRSRMRFDAGGFAVFEGVMSMEQNGGFASVRARVAAPLALKVAAYVLDVRGDGKRYKLNLRVPGRFEAVSYQASFETKAEAWATVRIPVDTFEATFRGRKVQAPPLDATQVREVGLMIADRQDGAFALQVRGLGVEPK